MTDEKNPELVSEEAAAVPADPWAAAFAAIATEDAVDAGADGEAGTGGQGDGDAPDPAAGAGPEPDDGAKLGDVGLDKADDGGAAAGAEPAGAADDLEPVFAEGEVEEQLAEIKKTVTDQAVKETAEFFLEKGIRHDDQGRLGATINDPDIYRRDENGVPTFYNPDTGKPFTGDNPRAQARAWVREYNEELKETFNKVAAQKAAELEEQAQPMVQLLQFAPKFEKLDPVRQRMLDAMIEDYEITDSNGDVIGYSCDLDKALGQVNRQIEMIRAARANAPEKQAQPVAAPQKQEKAKSSPAVDMKASAGSNPGKPQFKSIAEAMEWEQDQMLQKMRGKK